MRPVYIDKYFTRPATHVWCKSSHQMRRCNQLFASGLDTSHYPFHRAALNAGRSNREKGVRPSVRLSFKRVDCEKTEEKSV